MFEVGKTYPTVGGDKAHIIGKANEGTLYETVYSIEGNRRVHRYNSRDFGRVTGTSISLPDPRNLVVYVEEPGE